MDKNWKTERTINHGVGMDKNWKRQRKLQIMALARTKTERDRETERQMMTLAWTKTESDRENYKSWRWHGQKLKEAERQNEKWWRWHGQKLKGTERQNDRKSSSLMLLYVQTDHNYKLRNINDGSPGRPPRLSDSSWVLKMFASPTGWQKDRLLLIYTSWTASTPITDVAIAPR